MNDTEKLRRRIADSAAELLAEGKTAGCAVRIAQSGELLLSANSAAPTPTPENRCGRMPFSASPR